MSEQNKSPNRFPEAWALPRAELAAQQLERLNQLLQKVVPASGLYREKLGEVVPQLASLDELKQLPLTTKQELTAAADNQSWRTLPDAEYVRFHQTSGTSGRPMVVLDTAVDWGRWITSWRHTLYAAEVGPGDRAFLAFSFGPFVGFWSACDALQAHGVRVIPGGGLSSIGRIDLIQRAEATCLLGTPSYVLHLAKAAHTAGLDTAQLPIKTVIVAGEPGGSLPATRRRIAEAWGARVVDHAGATEVGAWGFGDDLWNDPPGLRIVETDFLAEFLSVETGEPASDGELSHLVLTNLGRIGAPVIRYMTGDLVRPEWPESGPCRFVRLAGGIVGRADDMVVVRGVNISPSSIEEVLRTFDEVQEWRITVERHGEMDELFLEIEAPDESAQHIAEALQLRLGLRVPVQTVELGSLPRSEHKSMRLQDKRKPL